MGRRSSEGGAGKVTWHDLYKAKAAEQIKHFKPNEVGLEWQKTHTGTETKAPCMCSQR